MGTQKTAADKSEGGEIPLKGLWFWIVMLPVATFALLLTTAVLWTFVGQPIAARIAPPAATAAPAPITALDAMTRAARLTTLVQDVYSGKSDPAKQPGWYRNLTAYRVEGDRVLVNTDLAPGAADVEYANRQYAQRIAVRFMRDMRDYGDMVTNATVYDRSGQIIITETWKPEFKDDPILK